MNLARDELSGTAPLGLCRGHTAVSAFAKINLHRVRSRDRAVKVLPSSVAPKLALLDSSRPGSIARSPDARERKGLPSHDIGAGPRFRTPAG